MCQSSTIHLNDFVHIFIQKEGMEYVANNYIDIRQDYYNLKETKDVDDTPSEKGE